MGLFGALVRTAVNVVKLPVSLPVAVARDTINVMCADETREVRRVVRELKEDAEDR